LTAREREVARLVVLGCTNREIGASLSISERTVDAHIQNILNKLGANNRAQIAAWSARDAAGSVDLVAKPAPPASVSRPTSHRLRPRMLWPLAGVAIGLVVVIAVVGWQLLAPTKSARVTRGPLVYEASFRGDGAGFSSRYTIGDPSASAIRFTRGAVEYVVLRPGGNTGNNVGMAPLKGYFVEVELSVEPGSNVEFWIDLTGAYTQPVGKHLIGISTQASEMQMSYFHDQFAQPLGALVPIEGLQTGRSFTISAFVNPPHYQVYLADRSVIGLQHEPSVEYQAPAFAIFGEGGNVRLSRLRVYSLAAP
jgi:DNA-binding CsgD family transcriptional regulator